MCVCVRARDLLISVSYSLSVVGNSTGNDIATELVPTFDLVDIQLYESWSHAGFQIDVKMVPANEYLVSWITKALKPFKVDFAQVPGVHLPTQTLTISPRQLVVGFSAGMGNGKSVFIWPEAMGSAYAGTCTSIAYFPFPFL